MAFFTTVNMQVPVVMPDAADNTEEAALEEFLIDERVGQEV